MSKVKRLKGFWRPTSRRNRLGRQHVLFPLFAWSVLWVWQQTHCSALLDRPWLTLTDPGSSFRQQSQDHLLFKTVLINYDPNTDHKNPLAVWCRNVCSRRHHSNSRDSGSGVTETAEYHSSLSFISQWVIFYSHDVFEIVFSGRRLYFNDTNKSRILKFCKALIDYLLRVCYLWRATLCSNTFHSAGYWWSQKHRD